MGYPNTCSMTHPMMSKKHGKTWDLQPETCNLDMDARKPLIIYDLWYFAQYIVVLKMERPNI